MAPPSSTVVPTPSVGERCAAHRFAGVSCSLSCRPFEPSGGNRNKLIPRNRRRASAIVLHMLLYDSPVSGNCYKVRLLLAHLGVPFERQTVDVRDRSTRPELLGDLN